MFAKFDMPPDFKVTPKPDSQSCMIRLFFKGFCTNRRSYYGKTNLYNTYYQWVAIYFMIQVTFSTLLRLLDLHHSSL